MKDDNILLEALKEIRDQKLKPGETDYRYAFNRNWHIATNVIEKYNQSPSDESNQGYWHKRCKAAEAVILYEQPKYSDHLNEWQKIKNLESKEEAGDHENK